MSETPPLQPGDSMQVNVRRENPADRTSKIEVSEPKINRATSEDHSDVPLPTHADKLQAKYRTEVESLKNRAEEAARALSPAKDS